MYKLILEKIDEQQKLDHIVNIIQVMRDLYPERALVEIVSMVIHLPAEIGRFVRYEEASLWRTKLESCGSSVKITEKAKETPPVFVSTSNVSSQFSDLS